MMNRQHKIIMDRVVKLFVVFVLISTAMIIASPVALAQVAEAIANCNSFTDQGGITTPVMMCVTTIMEAVASDYVTDLAGKLSDTILAAMTLAVLFLSTRVALGATNAPAAESILLVIKIALISYFVSQAAVIDYLGYLRDFTAGLTDVLVGAVPENVWVMENFSMVEENEGKLGGTTAPTASPTDVQSACDNYAFPTGVVPPGGIEIWHKIDCIIYRVLGLGHENVELSADFIGFAILTIGTFFIGPVGTFIQILSSFMFFFLFGALGMILFTYIASMMAVMILGAFSPLIIPMVLFRNTRDMFDKWLEQIISFSLQPLILTAFLVFMLNVMNIALVDILTRYKEMKETTESADAVSYMTIGGTPNIIKDSDKEGVKERTDFENFVITIVNGKQVMQPTEGSAKGVGGNKQQVPILKWDYEKHKEIIISFVITLFLAFIMVSFMRILPGLVTELVGSRNITNLAQRMGQPVLDSALKANAAVQGALKAK